MRINCKKYLLIVVEPIVILIWDVQSEFFLLAYHVLRKSAQHIDRNDSFDFLPIQIEYIALGNGENSFLSPFTLVNLADFITENDLLSVEVLKHFCIFVQTQKIMVLLQDLHASIDWF